MNKADIQGLWIYVTCGSKKEAHSIAGEAVRQNLAACGNVLPGMESVYQWKGKIESDQETVLILKSTRDRFDDLEALVLSLHSYDCPCIVALPIEAGNSDFLSWIHQSVHSE